MKDNKIQYQMTVVFSPKTEEKDKNDLLDKIESKLSDMGGKTAKKEKLGLKDLSYSIKGHNKGEFYVCDIESEKNLSFRDLELFLNRDANIIRYLILKI